MWARAGVWVSEIKSCWTRGGMVMAMARDSWAEFPTGKTLPAQYSNLPYHLQGMVCSLSFLLPLFHLELSFLLADLPSLILAGSGPSPPPSSEKPWCSKAGQQYLFQYLVPVIRWTTNVNRDSNQNRLGNLLTHTPASFSRYLLPPLTARSWCQGPPSRP